VSAPRTNGAASLKGIDRWASLELRHLFALSALAREGTFAQAAQALGYSQSALSQQIATLEKITRTRARDRCVRVLDR
jgi:DNA-binding MarR family transcriptional regulator